MLSSAKKRMAHWKGGMKGMSDAVIMTAIICVTVFMITYITKGK